MSTSAFGRVKAAVSSQAEAILREYGVKSAHGDGSLKGEFTTGFLCPFCGDKSGSASFSHELFLKCHQCGRKEDIFEWLGKMLSISVWECCQKLAERLKVDIKIPKAKRKKGLPARMTDELAAQCARALWEAPEADIARKTLAERGLDDQRALMDLEVGWCSGYIVFPQRKEKGDLDDKFRAWAPWAAASAARWRWVGGGKGGPGIWPGAPAPEGSKILLCEGESDTLTARIRLRMGDHGWHCATWTSGAGNCPKPIDIPRSWHGKDVHIAYDNDVFQGPNYAAVQVVVKPGKKPEEARGDFYRRLKNLLERVGPLFISLGCRVFIRQCPIDPLANYGGDLRDYVTGGGNDFDADWKCYPLSELPKIGHEVLDVEFDKVFTLIAQPIRTRVQVELISSDDLVIPRVIQMKCQLGAHPVCSSCLGLAEFPDGRIDMDDHARERVVSMAERDANKWLVDNLVQPPQKCPGVELVAQKTSLGSLWCAARTGQSEETAQRTLRVYSEQTPSLSGEVEVEGTPYVDSSGKSMLLYAPHISSLDKADIDLVKHLDEWRSALPWEQPHSPARIEVYLEQRWRDLSFNVTRIHGRRDIQIAHDLMMHSAIGFRFNGAVHRGWLDICIFGETRSGKSITIRRMIEHHRLGTYHAATSNMSRAGTTVGADRQGMVRPGIMPKNHRKAVFLDEMHYLVQNALKSNQEHPMSWLQSCRDEGRVHAIKIYGSRDFPSKVRLCIIANWMRGRRGVYEHACEHLGGLYGSPETLARADFAVMVGPTPTEYELPQVEQWWTAERTRDLILRAWAQDVDNVIIEPEAEDYAKRIAQSWRGRFESEALPLFTPEEKALSLMRTAVAVANLMFSHPRGDAYSVVVTKIHVEWAAEWYLHLWAECGYDKYSAARSDRETIDRPFLAERLLTVNNELQDSTVADLMLSSMLQPFTANDMMTTFGKDQLETAKWLSALQQARVIERMRNNGGWNIVFSVTKGGEQLIHNIQRLARESPERWVERYHRLKIWVGPKPPQGLSPMNEDFDVDGDPHGQALPF